MAFLLPLLEGGAAIGAEAGAVGEAGAAAEGTAAKGAIKDIKKLEKDTNEKTDKLEKTTKKVKQSDTYNPLEQAILKQEGIKPRGFWFARDNEMVKKEEITRTLESNPTIIIVKKLDIIDNKITTLIDISKNVLKNTTEQLDFLKRTVEDMEIEKEEASLKGKKNNRDVEPVDNSDKEKTKMSGSLMLLLGAGFLLFARWLGNLKTAFGAWMVVSLSKIGKTIDNAIKSIIGAFKKRSTVPKNIGKDEKALINSEEEAKEARAAYEEAKNLSSSKGKSIVKKTLSFVEKKTLQFFKLFKPLLEKGKSLLKFLGKFVGIIGTLLVFSDAIIDFLSNGFKLDDKVKSDFLKAFGALIGAIVGEAGGTAIGAFFGSIVPIIGTAIGGVIGGLVGSFVGANVGEYIAKKVGEWIFDGKDIGAILKEFVDDTFNFIKTPISNIGSFFGFGPKKKDPGATASSKPTPTTTNVPRQMNNAQMAGIKGLGGNGSTAEAMNYLTKQGWTKEQAAGIIGNLQVESGINLKINALGDNGRAYGIAQWHPDRQNKFSQLYNKDIRESNFKEQLAFLNWELNNSEKRAGNIIRGATSAADAAALFDIHYERSSGTARQQRIANAAAIIGGKNNGIPTSTSFSTVNPVSFAKSFNGGGGSGGGGGSTAQSSSAPKASTNPSAGKQSLTNQPTQTSQTPLTPRKPVSPGIQYGIPNPVYTMIKEDCAAVFFNSGEPLFGVAGLT